MGIASGGTFNNTGTVENGGASGLTVQLNGTFNNQSGGLLKLVENAFFSAGIFNNNAGASVDLNFKEIWLLASHIFNLSGAISGTGNFVVSGGTFNNSGSFTHHAPSTSFFLYSNGKVNILAGGSLVFNSPFTVVDGVITNTAGTLTINAPFTTPDSLTIGAGGALNLNSSLQLSSAGAVLNLSGTFTPNNAVLIISGATLNNSTNLTVNLSGGGPVVDLDFPTGTIYNLSGGVLTFDDDFTFSPQRVYNQSGGTLAIGASKTVTCLSLAIFVNNGTMSESGSLTINGGTFNNSGTATHNPASRLTLTFSAGDFVNLNNGVLTLNGNFTVPTGLVLHNFDNATISNNGTLTVAGQIANSAILTNTGIVNNNGSISNSGTLNQSGGTFENSGSLAGPDGTVNITGGIFNNNAGITLTHANSSSGQTIALSSAGTLMNKSGATLNLDMTFAVTSGGILNNAGTINVGTGVALRMQGNQLMTNSGVVNIAGTSAAFFIDSALSGVSNTGTFSMSGGGFFHGNAGVFNNNSPGTFNASDSGSGAQFGTSTFNNHAGATVSMIGTGFYINPFGTVNNGGTFGGSSGGSLIMFAGLFYNTGSVTFDAGFLLLNFGTLIRQVINQSGGVMTLNHDLSSTPFYFMHIENQAGGTMNINSFVQIQHGKTFTNYGTLNLAGSLATDADSYIFNLGGTLNLLEGSYLLASFGTFINQNATIKGKGTIYTGVGTSYNAGSVIQPGASPGTLTIENGLNLGVATYNCEINGATPGTGHDVIAVNGDATLTNASLVVDWGSYTPTGGESFDIMSFGSRTGTFASTTIPPVAGLNFTVSYISTKVTLNALLLPVELIDFTAKPVENKVLLEWATASELNADRFEVEHSTDGFFFEKIAEQTAAGNSTSEQRYDFLDEKPVTGVNYYRLRQVDFDGAFEYSEVAAVDLSGFENLTGLGLLLYPNPSSGSELNIRLMGDQFELGGYEIFDAMGRLVRQGVWEANGGEFQVKMDGHLPTGSYAIQLKDKQLRSVAVQRFEVVN